MGDRKASGGFGILGYRLGVSGAFDHPVVPDAFSGIAGFLKKPSAVETADGNEKEGLEPLFAFDLRYAVLQFFQ